MRPPLPAASRIPAPRSPGPGLRDWLWTLVSGEALPSRAGRYPSGSHGLILLLRLRPRIPWRQAVGDATTGHRRWVCVPIGHASEPRLLQTSVASRNGIAGIVTTWQAGSTLFTRRMTQS